MSYTYDRRRVMAADLPGKKEPVLEKHAHDELVKLLQDGSHNLGRAWIMMKDIYNHRAYEHNESTGIDTSPAYAEKFKALLWEIEDLKKSAEEFVPKVKNLAPGASKK